jgi:Leucine-rich repeat (LRR) protein
MNRFLFATLLCAIGHCALSADTDGDGLLDVIDVAGFDANASGEVVFGGRGIQDLDGANLLANATSLHLFNNRITSLENGNFQGLTNLQTLDLEANQITSIESGDFQGLTNLQTLRLAFNQIPSLESGAFQGLSNLRALGLPGNQIPSLESGAFQGLSNLRGLSLSENQITSLDSGAFQGLSNLQTLYLQDNHITSLESRAFEGLSSLQTLYLQDNQITSLESGAFEGLSSLQLLLLHNNQITSIEGGALQGLSNLQQLWLSSNQITSIENGAFSGLNNLRTLWLQRNQITELNLTGATFDSFLNACFFGSGFCADSLEITDLILDDAVLSLGSFEAIVGETTGISNVSLVGLRFSDMSPDDLSNLLSLEQLDNVRVDQALFDRYAAEFNAFDAIPGNTVTVVPEPSAFFLCTPAWILGWAFCQRRHARHVSS